MRFLPILAISLGNILFATADWKEVTYYHDKGCDQSDFQAQYFEWDKGAHNYCFNVSANAPVHSIYDPDVGDDSHGIGAAYYTAVSFEEPGCKGRSWQMGKYSQCVAAGSKNETIAVKSWQNIYHSPAS